MSRLIREKFVPVRPEISNRESRSSTAGVSSSSSRRNGCTTQNLYRSRFSLIQAVRLLRPRSLKKRNVSRVKTGVAGAMKSLVRESSPLEMPLSLHDSKKRSIHGVIQIGACGCLNAKLVCRNEQIYSDRTNQGSPQTGPRQLRPRADLFDPR